MKAYVYILFVKLHSPRAVGRKLCESALAAELRLGVGSHHLQALRPRDAHARPLRLAERLGTAAWLTSKPGVPSTGVESHIRAILELFQAILVQSMKGQAT